MISFEQLAHEANLAHGRDSSTTWRYTVRGIPGTLYIITTERVTSDEAIRILAQHFGIENVLTLEGGAS